METCHPSPRALLACTVRNDKTLDDLRNHFGNKICTSNKLNLELPFTTTTCFNYNDARNEREVNGVGLRLDEWKHFRNNH
jgi:hypothetical protein